MSLTPPSGSRYRRLSDEIRREFGERLPKVAIDAGMTCPNRDGRLGVGGCSYCDPDGSGPGRGEPRTIEEQIGERRPAGRFIAYLQSFSNTYGPPERLDEILGRVASIDGVAAVAIGTRPDCVPEPTLDVIERWAQRLPVWVEYGLQSAHLRTLQAIRRGHTPADFVDAFIRTRARHIRVVAHVILGLPGEDLDDMIETARFLSALKVDGVKIHMLHVVRGSALQEAYEQGEIRLFTREQYVEAVCDFLEHLDESIIVHRLTGERPRPVLIAPDWVREKGEVLRMIEAELERRDSRQGCRVGFSRAVQET